jgi:hypothetical protein
VRILQVLVALAPVAFVLMAAFGVVLFVTQVLFPRWSERVLRRLAGPGGDAKAGV